MPEFGQNRLVHERKAMKAYRRSFMLALRETPDPTGVGTHMLETLEMHITAQGQYSDLAVAVENVSVFERTHPDVAMFGSELGLTESQIDDLFRLAQQIEAGF